MRLEQIRRLLVAILIAAPAFGQSPWYTAYYATWNQTSLNGSSWNGERLGQPPDQVDWTGVTHVVHFGNGNVTSTAPYSLFATDSTEITYGPGGGNTNYQNQLINVCHAKNVKVCLSIQAVDGAPLLAVVQDATKLNVFCEWIVQYAKRHGYDGVEIDWESSFPTTAQMTTFITKLRATLDKYYSPAHAVIMTSANLSDFNMYAPALDAMIDQYNIQTYAMMWTPNDNNLTWHTCAVYPGTSSSGAEGALDGITNGDVGYPQKWVNAGHDPSRVGLLLPTFGYFCLGADGLLQKPTSIIGHNGSMTVTQNSMLTGLLSVGGTTTWDAVRQMDYISGTATAAYGSSEYGGVKAGQKFFATVPTPRWVQAVVDYYNTKKFNGKSLGGLSLYSLTEDLDPTKPAGAGRNVIHDALRDALSGVARAPFGSLTASPATVSAGDSVTLTWTSTGADSGSIDHGIGTIALPGGSKKVQVTATTTYTLTLKNSTGTSTSTATVTVATPTAPTGTLAVAPATAASGDSVTLSWTSSGAASGSIDQGVGTIALPSGTRKVRVAATTTFTLSLTNTVGTTTKTATVNVTPSGSFTATPASITQGDSVTLSWTASTNADSAVINQGIGKVTPTLAGSRRVKVNTTATFTLTLYNAAGTKNYSATVTAAVAGAPTGTFQASPTHVAAGDSVTLSWTASANTTGGQITPGVGAISPLASGSKKVRVLAATTFTLALTNNAGTTNYTATVAIDTGAAQITGITPLGTPIAFVTSPTGGGNHSLSVISQNAFVTGNPGATAQYDTWTGAGIPRPFDWVGYAFPTPHTFHRLIYQEGLDNQFGGCFQSLSVQVCSGGTWYAVSGLSSSPTYPSANGVSWQIFTLNFSPMTGDSIRLYGPPTGTDNYIGVSRLWVFDTTGVAPPPAPPPRTTVPKDYGLDQNYPNPFNPSTHIVYKLPAATSVRLSVYNVLGQELVVLADGFQSAGFHEVLLSGDRLANGLYFYVLVTPEFKDVRKMTVLH